MSDEFKNSGERLTLEELTALKEKLKGTLSWYKMMMSRLEKLLGYRELHVKEFVPLPAILLTNDETEARREGTVEVRWEGDRGFSVRRWPDCDRIQIEQVVLDRPGSFLGMSRIG
ncbi:MAG: hypothetical protein IKM31_03395 [Oscillospiraceae bacterium]|nr:hypothetical protein [Oscillospiraceae bacterium]